MTSSQQLTQPSPTKQDKVLVIAKLDLKLQPPKPASKMELIGRSHLQNQVIKQEEPTDYQDRYHITEELPKHISRMTVEDTSTDRQICEQNILRHESQSQFIDPTPTLISSLNPVREPDRGEHYPHSTRRHSQDEDLREANLNSHQADIDDRVLQCEDEVGEEEKE